VPIKLLHGRKIIEELNKQLRLMGQLAKGQRSTFHRELDDTHALSSQQIGAHPFRGWSEIQAGQHGAKQFLGLDGHRARKACGFTGAQFGK
jgi:hypothetical protein